MDRLRWYEATKLVLQLLILAAVISSAVWMQINFTGTGVNLLKVKKDIIDEVTAARERRLDELHSVVKTEQLRQDAVTADIAVKADKRATVAENKAEVAKGEAKVARSKAVASEKRLKRVETVLQPVLDNPAIAPALVPALVAAPEPTPTIPDTNPKRGGLFGIFDK